MYDILIILMFWAMVLAPSMVAMNIGLHLYSEDESDDLVADGSEFEPASYGSRMPLPRPWPRDVDR
jgi:hypothetical protein